MARPRRDNHDALMQRIALALAARENIRPWTLAEIAPSAGLSPAGLIKRFGSRKGILTALSRRWINAIPSRPVGTVPALDELRTWVHERFAPEDARATAQGLTQLIDDLIDDELRSLLDEGWAREQAYLAALLSLSGLPGITDASACAAILFDSLNGAMLRRAVTDDGDPVTHTLNTLLEMWT